MLKHSQNFINNKGLIQKIFDSIDLDKNIPILEIGPGRGIITSETLKRYKNVIVIEADNTLAKKLKRKYENNDNIRIICGDFLKYKLPREKFNILSNIPFNITSDIIRKITSENSTLDRAYLIMQEAAAYKFVEIEGRESSLLSKLLHINYNIRFLFKISKENFTPRPKYGAALVLFEKKHPRDLLIKPRESERFRDFLCYIFDRSRPNIGDALLTVTQNKKNVVNLVLQRINLNKDLKIKAVSFIDWVNIFHMLGIGNNWKLQKAIRGSYKKLLIYQSNLEKIRRTRKY